MAGDRIMASPAELREASANFASKAEDIREILDYLRNEVSQLEMTWDGLAQDQFFVTYEDMAGKMDQFPVVVDGISETLSKIAETLEDVDAQLASAIQQG